MKRINGLIVAAALGVGCLLGVAQENTQPPASSPVAASAPLGGEVMPLIVIDDAPLPDAIRNLARQAGLNIQFDPQVLAGLPDPSKPGVTLPPPNVSFRWENITAMQALHAVLENHNLQLVLDPKTKISRVTAKDPAALEPLISKVILLKYSHPTNMIPMVKAAFATPRSQVIADTRTGQLLVLATEKEMQTIEALIAKLDTAPSQILIEARFMETTKNPRSAKGVDWSGTLAANNVSFGNNSFFTEGLEPQTPTSERPLFPGVRSGALADPRVILSTSGGFGPVGFLNSDGLSAVVSFLNSDNQTETIATPRAVASEGVPTELSVVQNVPVFEEEQGQNVGGSVSPNTVKPNYNLQVSGNILNEVGTKLIVTPRIYGVTNVYLDLKPEISEVGPDATTTLGGRVSRAPTFLRKKIQTQAMVPSGNTLVLGGLREDRDNKNLTKVPLLGDIPGVGRAFRSDVKQRNNRQLLIFVTPTILSSEDFLPGEDSRTFLHQQPVIKTDVQWGPYDNSEPKDWTKQVD